MGNCFRMFLNCLATNLLVSLRQTIAGSPSEEGARNYLDQDFVSAEERTSRERRRHFNHHRKADPLGEALACTWRMRLIKIATRIKVTARRVRVFLCGLWSFLTISVTLARRCCGVRNSTSPLVVVSVTLYHNSVTNPIGSLNKIWEKRGSMHAPC